MWLAENWKRGGEIKCVSYKTSSTSKNDLNVVANSEGTTNFTNPSFEVDFTKVSRGRRVLGDLTNCALNLSERFEYVKNFTKHSVCSDVNSNIVGQHSCQGVNGGQVGIGTLLRPGKSVISTANIVQLSGVEKNVFDAGNLVEVESNLRREVRKRKELESISNEVHMVNFGAHPLLRPHNIDSACGLDLIEDLFNGIGANAGVGAGDVEDVDSKHHSEGVSMLYFCVYSF